MARVEVHGGSVSGGLISKLDVRMHGLPPRSVDRDTVLSWMKDGHSFVPVQGGQDQPALVLVEIVDGEDVKHFVRQDAAKESADQVPVAE